jgi:hypothetical protein
MGQAIPDLLQALCGEDDSSAEATAAGLAGLDPALQPRALAALQALLCVPQVDQRWWAARALAALPGRGHPLTAASFRR